MPDVGTKKLYWVQLEQTSSKMKSKKLAQYYQVYMSIGFVLGTTYLPISWQFYAIQI